MPVVQQFLRKALILFSRYPEPGKVKTRLIPVLGPEKAARLQCDLMQGLLGEAEALLSETEVIIAFQGGSRTKMRSLFGRQWSYAQQSGQDLGQRMLHALSSELDKGLERVLLCGSDCPGLSTAVLRRGFDALQHHDLVLGPALDGGYYLIGARQGLSRKRLAPIFTGIDWGTDRVLRQTEHKAKHSALQVGRIDVLGDIDRPEDLKYLPPDRGEADQPLISLVVPALNEEDHLKATLETLRTGVNIEIIVVDGGSRDRTLELAAGDEVRLFQTGPGRAGQMNVGAAQARGDILVFVHADTKLPFGYDLSLRRAVNREGALGGAFTFALERPFPGSRLVTRLVNLRSRYLRLPYGDQALFVRADVFARLGGYPEVPILEDVHLLRKIKARGEIVQIGLPAVTSGRRWEHLGLVKTTCVNQCIMIGDFLGISPHRLVKLYGKK